MCVLRGGWCGGMWRCFSAPFGRQAWVELPETASLSRALLEYGLYPSIFNVVLEDNVREYSEVW